MPRCEDWPCYGHEDGGCPERDAQGRERFRCAHCRRILPPNAQSSICPRCMRRIIQIDDGRGRSWDEY